MKEKCGRCKGEGFLYTPHKIVCTYCYGKKEFDWIEQVIGLSHPHKETFSFDSSKDDGGELMLRLKMKYGVQ